MAPTPRRMRAAGRIPAAARAATPRRHRSSTPRSSTPPARSIPEAFASLNGPAFYGLAPNADTITLRRESGACRQLPYLERGSAVPPTRRRARWAGSWWRGLRWAFACTRTGARDASGAGDPATRRPRQCRGALRRGLSAVGLLAVLAGLREQRHRLHDRRQPARADPRARAEVLLGRRTAPGVVVSRLPACQSASASIRVRRRSSR